MALVDRKKRLAYYKQYNEAHKEQNKEWSRAYSRQYYETHKEQCKAYNRGYRHRYRYLLKVEILVHYSACEYPICAYCGEDDVRVLQIDHIEGGGRQHRQQLGTKAGREFYRWLKKQEFPEGFQVLCANCNIRKDYEMRNLLRGAP